ncbi:MAG TPA: DUF4126 domain-containing protein [Ktedonobacteraceae bacterium]|nr:DUF4126 domain-containing protein [Ktedonobacteraceae bacterium]
MEILGIQYGLVWLSGFNSYAVLLALVIDARFIHRLPVNLDSSFLKDSNGVLFLLIGLVALDFFAEKIPFVDQLWNILHTIMRPLTGMFIMHLTHTSFSPFEHIALLVSAGVIAAMAHSAKLVLRLLAVIGCASPLISIAENLVTVMIIVLAFVNPLILLILAAMYVLLFVYFLPLILSGLYYQWCITRSLLAWMFGARVRLETFNVTLSLSEREKKHLQARVPQSLPIQAGVRLIWRRRLGKHWLKWWWGNRRVATPTWLLFTDREMILLPNLPQNALEILPFNQILAVEAQQGLVKGSLKITLTHSQGIQVYECAVLRPEWNVVETLIRPFQVRQGRVTQPRSFYPFPRQN